MFVVRRSKHNPILGPNHNHSFEAHSAFNGSPIELGKKIHLLYRAQSLPETFENHHFSQSIIAQATSNDGVHFDNHEPFIIPEKSWERYGCEDPRVTKIDGKYFIFYTALSVYPFGPDGIKVGLAISKDLKKITEKHLITPFNSKAMVLFPQKIGGEYVALVTVNPDKPPSTIALARFKKIEEMWSEKFWNKWYKNLSKHVLDIPRVDGEQVEIGAVPIKTDLGWLLVYSHIQNYYSSDQKIFGIQTLLLDSKNPQKVIGRTRGALLVPEESYEKYGQVQNTIFPSGALVRDNKLMIYYGATDTTCALAEVSLPELLTSMKLPRIEDGFKRLTEGPLLIPRPSVSWEAKAIFNPAAIYLGGKFNILYRAMSNDNTSVVGLAQSKDGTNITYRSDEPIYTPRESFEEKRIPGGNSGCEDPRVTKIGDRIYMTYTAYNGITPPAIAQTNISEKDFLAKNWKGWSKPVLVSRDGVDDKDGCLHPELVNGKYFLFHRVNNTICGDFGETPEFKERNNFRNIPILLPRRGMWDSVKVGMSVPPIKTKKGWILLYHGVSGRSRYRVGAALLDLKDPTIVLARTTDALFEPLTAYEIQGQVNYVVFPCGAIVKDNIIYMYYGGADSVVDVSSLQLDKLLDILTK
jgi:beta-1,2-mannobiose phosphorylase / 1,2-beta-oligomannan phosphorylase